MCDDPALPPAVAGALEDYRALLAAHGVTWGEDPIFYVMSMATDAYLMGPRDFWGVCHRKVAERHPDADPRELEDHLVELDMAEVVRDVLAGEVLENLAALRLTADGAVLEAKAQAVLDGRPLETTLLVDSARTGPATVVVGGRAYEVAPGGALLIPITSAVEVAADGSPVDLSPLTRPAATARLRLRAGMPCRWSVYGEHGQGWYPAGAPHRRDAHVRPYFHGDDLVLDVPAEPLTVRVARGMEYGSAEAAVTPVAGEETLVELAPERLHDAAARGWYGGDMHVHLNWAGDMVGTPALAAAMQHGEDLHVLNLVAGNVSSARVYDAEALEHWAGEDLPWSDAAHLARLGVEYRNDLLGHFYAFAPAGPPSRFHTGFLGTADWPPNSAACRELRALGAVTGYSHPFHAPVSETDGPEAVLLRRRNCSSREIVADAALGLVDALDVLNHSSVEGTALVYRRLLGAGNRLAVTAGTDSMISFARRGCQSSPPGWARVYARVEGPLTAESFAEAIRRGRTFGTTGPWLELSVDGHGPGDALDLPAGARVTVTARAVGPEVERLELRTADGVIAVGPGGGVTVAGPGGGVTVAGPGGAPGGAPVTEVTAELVVTEPTYVVAVASGGPHERSFHPTGVHAHTSPVHLDVDGRRVARPEDVRWCLEWLDGLEAMVREEGRFESAGQLADHLALYDRAREVYRSRLHRGVRGWEA
ncbi:CehA/McbA family metallohydrolase [Planomonospora sp. ID82291]|uniref:CehA/McbA family metallohydrolase n=1 Tax=Planomonospora sp. ID82291 TaxID=2738136 RepID=UPI0018C396AD|nr:CehA/McbA family metallohydrolase [Planomonospora sp. ID82291]MBG0817593.1 CehA/McbA family metallohydrolase [Planomonospora sp. ID82291]